MCGILGSFNNDKISKDFFKEALQTMISRGPDAQDTYSKGNKYLGHVRLSIIDLDKGSDQPFLSKCGRYVTVYNGEIYNYKELKREISTSDFFWKTSGDTELLIEAYKKWGKDCLDKFNGMFAFVIWDLNENSLFGARDRLGKKPFYYNTENGFAFSSTIQALVKFKNRSKISNQSLRYFLELGYMPKESTIFENILQLEPGSYFKYENNKLKINKYWSINNYLINDELANFNEEKIIDQLDELLYNSVKLRLRSDVPVGVFLSGGIDSSLIAAYSKQLGGIKSYSLGFVDPKYDESGKAKEVANFLKIENKTEFVDSTNFINQFDTYLKEFNEPFFDSAAIPLMLLSKFARKDVTVALTGDGGDEFFGGYHYYTELNKVRKIQKSTLGLQKYIGKLIPKNRGNSLGFLSYLMVNKLNVNRLFPFLRSVIKDYPSVLKPEILNQTTSFFELFKNQYIDGMTIEENAMRFDIDNVLVNDYLKKTDVSTMTYSLEARSPLMDHKVVEFAAKLPLKYKIREGQNKYILRKLLYRYIPEKIVNKPKLGLRVPVAKWLKSDFKSDFKKMIENSSTELDNNIILDLYKLHDSGKRDVHPYLWTIFVYLKWRKLNENII